MVNAEVISWMVNAEVLCVDSHGGEIPIQRSSHTRRLLVFWVGDGSETITQHTRIRCVRV